SRQTECLRDWNSDVCPSDLVKISKAEQRPGKQRHHERVHSGPAGGDDPGHIPVRDESPVEDRIVAAGGTHAENVPGFLDDVAGIDRKSTRLNSSHLGISYAV